MVAGASTAGFLESVTADLEREVRTFKYPAMSCPNQLQLMSDKPKSEKERYGAPSNAIYTALTPPPPSTGSKLRQKSGRDSLTR